MTLFFAYPQRPTDPPLNFGPRSQTPCPQEPTPRSLDDIAWPHPTEPTPQYCPRPHRVWWRLATPIPVKSPIQRGTATQHEGQNEVPGNSSTAPPGPPETDSPPPSLCPA